MYDAAAVEAKVSQHLNPPDAPAAHVVEFFKSFEVDEPRAISKMTVSWHKRMCAHREHLPCTVFGLARHSRRQGREHFAFLYAVQNPQEAWFMHVLRKVDAMGVQLGHWQFQLFACEHGAYLSHDKLPFNDGDDIVVIEGLAFQNDGSLTESSLPQSLGDWETGWRLPETVHSTRVPPVSKTKLQEIKEKHPWIEACLQATGPSTGSRSSGALGSKDVHEDNCDADAVLLKGNISTSNKHLGISPPALVVDQP